MNKIKAGAVCRCQNGIIGIVISLDDSPTGISLYKGIKLDGSAWESKNPTVIAPTVKDFIVACAIDLDLFAEIRN